MNYVNKCPYCGSDNIAIGYQLGGGRLFTDQYAYHSQTRASEIEVFFCKDCGMVIAQKVLRPQIFDNVDDAREERLLDIIDQNGFLLVNKHNYLPSLDESGFTMQNIISLIRKHQVFYSKVFNKKPIYLSIKVYQLLKRVKKQKPLDDIAKMILKEMAKYETADKEEIKNNLGFETKTFNKAFDHLLEEMLITAIDGKKLTTNWYSYLYTTTDRFDKHIDSLHFKGDAKEELWSILKKTMDQKDFERLIK